MTTRPLMHGSTSPWKNLRFSSYSQRAASWTGAIARCASSLAGSSPNRYSRCSTAVVEVHSGKYVPPLQRPSASWALEELSSPPLAGDAGAFGRDLVGGRIGQVAHHLPADGGIGVEQPVNDVHALMVPRLPDTVWQESAIPDAARHDPTRNWRA